MVERSTLYFELREALAAGGCPLCRLRDQASDSYLHALIYEGVTDPPLREELRKARGLCHRHAWRQANRHGSVLGLAIIYQDVTNTLAKVLQDEVSNRRFNRQGLAKRLGPSAECPACRLERIALPRTIKTLLSYLEDPDIQAGYTAAGGLCLPHFQAALGQANDAQARTLAEWQLAVYSQLRDQLNELIRKHDHRFKSEPIGVEGDSWRRAVARMAGEAGEPGDSDA
jgi:hypothetical protein